MLRTALLVIVLVSPMVAADKTAPATPKITDPDFKFQGEYLGEVPGEDGGKMKVGLQVIARGKGAFDAVAYFGGLPGAGGNIAEKVKAKGKMQKDGTLLIEAEHGNATINADGTAVATDKDGNMLGTFKKVTRKSDTLGKKPPKGATVLFDGTSGKEFKNARVTKDGFLREGITSFKTFGDHTLHMEFRLSFAPTKRGQGRSNSGVYLQGRYEVQILDSFGLEGKDNECGGVYRTASPKVNMCLPPMQWQTYDIDFTGPRFDADGKKIANAKMTVRHNGVVIHKDIEIPKPTTASPLRKESGDQTGPVYIQNHGNPLWFRNIWVAPKKK